MHKSVKVGDYTVEVKFHVRALPHFCSGLWVYDFKVSVYNKKAEEVYNVIDIEEVLHCSKDQFGELVAGIVQEMILTYFNENCVGENTRCVLFAANHFDEDGSYYNNYYGFTQKELWDYIPNAKRMLAHDQAYDGGEVYIFSVPLIPVLDDWEEGAVEYELEDVIDYEEVAEEIEEKLKEIEKEEEIEEESLIDSILEEVL